MNANRGYVGWSRSVRAEQAEDDGKLPLSRAIGAVATRAGCTRAAARAALLAVGSAEWHHTSKFFNRTKYYDVGAAVAFLAAAPVRARLEAIGYAARIEATPRSNGVCFDLNALWAVLSELAAEAGCTVETVRTAYYGTWGDDG